MAGAASLDALLGEMLSAGDKVREGGGCGGVAGSALFQGEPTNRGLTGRRVAGDSGQLDLTLTPGARFSLREAALGAIAARAIAAADATVATEALPAATAGVGVGLGTGPPAGVSSCPIWWLRSQKSFSSPLLSPSSSSSSASSKPSVPMLPVSMEVRDRDGFREACLEGVVTTAIATAFAAAAAVERWEAVPTGNSATTGILSDPHTESATTCVTGSPPGDFAILALNSGETAVGQVPAPGTVFPLVVAGGIRARAWAWSLGLAWPCVGPRPFWVRRTATSVAVMDAFASPGGVTAAAVAAAIAAATPMVGSAASGELESFGPTPPAPLLLPRSPAPQSYENPTLSVSERERSSSSIPDEQ